MTSKSKLNVKEFVAILDFGSQYNQLIARRVRECNVYCEIFPSTVKLETLMARKPKGIIFSGGPDSVYNEDAPTVDPGIYKLGVPILGICYGMQLMAKMLGGKVESSDRREYGRTELHIVKHGALFGALNPQLMCWMSHGDIVVAPPPGFTVLAQTKNSPVAAMANDEARQYAVQFHPEVAHTPWGIEIIRNFLFKVCDCGALWTMGSYIDYTVKQIRDQVGKKPVLCALSGGVDSAAVAVLVHRAVKKQLTCIFVDHGFMRAGEPEQVIKTFRDAFKMKLIGIEASDRFLKALRRVTDPEKKRRIIGKEFIRLFEEESEKLGRMDFLAQGTLYPDVIESHSSGTGRSATIKSHHNVGGLPKDMQFELIEPLRYLFKDEVRALCTELGIPKEIAWRQPFPGPGLAIRIIGEVTQERLDTLKLADAIVMEEIRNANLEYEIWQAFAVLPAIKSVGVMGDQRTYAYPIILRAVTSDDGMTCDWARLPYELLDRMSSRIINEVPNVNRLVYDISTKPPSTIEWE